MEAEGARCPKAQSRHPDVVALETILGVLDPKSAKWSFSLVQTNVQTLRESEESWRLADFQALACPAAGTVRRAAPRRAAPRRPVADGGQSAPRRADPSAGRSRAASAMAPEGAQPAAASPAPDGAPAAPRQRLVIREMVLENFKSYAGAQRVGPFHKVREQGGRWGRGEGARAARGPAGGRAQEKTNVCARRAARRPLCRAQDLSAGERGGGSRNRAITCPPRARGRAHGAPPLRAPRQDVQRPPRCHFPLSVLQNAPPRGKSLRRATRRETAPSRRPRGIYGWRLVVGPPGRPAGRGAWPGAAASNSDSALGGRVARKQTRRAAPCGRMRPAAVQCVGRP